VRLIRTSDEARRYSLFDIVMPVPCHGLLRSLRSHAAALGAASEQDVDEASAVVTLVEECNRFDLACVLDTPVAYAEAPTEWGDLMLMNSPKGQPPRDAPVRFRPLVADVSGHLIAASIVSDRAALQGRRPTDEARRILLSDRLLLQRSELSQFATDAQVCDGGVATCMFDANFSRAALREAVAMGLPPGGDEGAGADPYGGPEPQFDDLGFPLPSDPEDNNTARLLPSAAARRGALARFHSHLRLPPPPSVSLDAAAASVSDAEATTLDADGTFARVDPATGAIVAAHPVTDTLGLTRTTTAVLRLRVRNVAAVPVLLRETFALHGAHQPDEFRLQDAVHGSWRSLDGTLTAPGETPVVDDAVGGAGIVTANSDHRAEACPVCFFVSHPLDKLSLCPLHRARLNRYDERRELRRAQRASADATHRASHAAAAAGDATASAQELHASAEEDREEQDVWAQAVAAAVPEAPLRASAVTGRPKGATLRGETPVKAVMGGEAPVARAHLRKDDTAAAGDEEVVVAGAPRGHRGQPQPQPQRRQPASPPKESPVPNAPTAKAPVPPQSTFTGEVTFSARQVGVPPRWGLSFSSKLTLLQVDPDGESDAVADPRGTARQQMARMAGKGKWTLTAIGGTAVATQRDVVAALRGAAGPEVAFTFRRNVARQD
jgi:hypothetical protein